MEWNELEGQKLYEQWNNEHPRNKNIPTLVVGMSKTFRQTYVEIEEFHGF
ncbi:MAG: hypothetical protein ACP5HX_02080 [Thermoproteota archaeon]